MMRAAVAVLLGAAHASEPEPNALPPHLQQIQDFARDTPEQLMAEIHASPLRAVVKEIKEPAEGPSAQELPLPTVTAHGMGDSCWEPGMASISRGIAKKTGSYARCVPTAGNIITDTIDGFLKNMDRSLDYFAQKIKEDPKLAGGFNAVGFSQGNSLIRGYIQKYNDPPVNAWLSVHGTGMGVSSFPSCFQQGKPVGLICKALDETLGELAYLKLAQDILFQADYFRDPVRVSSRQYKANSQLAQWNNENPAAVNQTFATNFAKTKKFAMVKAMKDSMVYPNEAEWWGQLPDGTYKKAAVTMKETDFYKNDMFGLKTADEAGKIFFESTPGDHLQFTEEELYGWVEKYFMSESVEAIQV